MNKYLSGIVSYCGGKRRVLSELYDRFNGFSKKIFYDLCGGAGVVTANCIAQRRIINDKSTDLAIIYKALSLKKTAYELARVMSNLKCNEETYSYALKYLQEHSKWKLDDYSMEELPIAAAYSWFVHFLSRHGNKIDNTPYDIENKKIRWHKLVNDKICDYIIAFRGVEVWNMDVVDAINRIKSEVRKQKEECVIYIDPPYLSDKRVCLIWKSYKLPTDMFHRRVLIS